MEFIRKGFWLIFTSAVSLFALCFTKACTEDVSPISGSILAWSNAEEIKLVSKQLNETHYLIYNIYNTVDRTDSIKKKGYRRRIRNELFIARQRCEENLIRINNLDAGLKDNNFTKALVDFHYDVAPKQKKLLQNLDNYLESPEQKGNIAELRSAMIAYRAAINQQKEQSLLDAISFTNLFAGSFYGLSTILLGVFIAYLVPIGIDLFRKKGTKSE